MENKTEAETMLYIQLAKFQQEMNFVKKGSKGYGYNYADLQSTIDTIKQGFEGKDLCFTQVMRRTDDNSIILETRIAYSNIEYGHAFIKSEMPLSMVHVVGKDGKNKTNDLQAFGSGMTYAKRYSLQAITGLPTGDDDGRTSNVSPPPVTRKVEPKPVKLKHVTTQIIDLRKDNLTEAIRFDKPENVAINFKQAYEKQGYEFPMESEIYLSKMCKEIKESIDAERNENGEIKPV